VEPAEPFGRISERGGVVHPFFLDRAGERKILPRHRQKIVRNVADKKFAG